MSFLYLRPGDRIVFPDPRGASREGLLAIGGDLSPRRLLTAYALGIFPWFSDDALPEWWSPDPRAVIPVDDVHVSRSLARRLRRGEFRLSWNEAFDDVLDACATENRDGTWILPSMVSAYRLLHRLGHAHSLEVWMDGALAGGIYGVHLGGLFAGESMFHRRTDASKIALVACVRSVAAAGIRLFDVQMSTPHLTSLGAVEWPRSRYLDELERIRELPVQLGELIPDWRERD